MINFSPLKLGVSLLLACSAAMTYAATSNVVQVAGGARHAMVLLENGVVAGWGNNYAGQLADAGEPLPKQRMVLEPMPLTLPGTVQQLAADEEHSLALMTDGSVWAFGRGYDGQLGIGDAGTRMRLAVNDRPGSAQPLRVSGISDAVQIATTTKACFALRKDGSVAGWGSGDGGLLGPNHLPARWGEEPKKATTPITLSGLSGITRIAIGPTHGLALTEDGRILSWGNNASGALGRQTSDKMDATPQFVEGLTGVIDIAAGGATSAAITRDGSVWVWGSNTYGMLATGDTPAHDETDGWTSKPKRISGISQAVNVQIGSPGRHIVVLLKDGTLRSWGNSDWGQVGAGVSGDSQASVQKPKINDVKKIWAAGNNTFAVKKDGSLWIWGSEYVGKYGGKGVLARNHKTPTPFPLTVGEAKGQPGSYAANKETIDSSITSLPQSPTSAIGATTAPIKKTVDDTLDLFNKGMNVFRSLKGL